MLKLIGCIFLKILQEYFESIEKLCHFQHSFVIYHHLLVPSFLTMLIEYHIVFDRK